MKSLSDYTQEAQTELFNKYGVFFAFSDKQFDEAKKEGVKYSSMGAGMICPTEHCKAVWEGLSAISKEGREQDLKENGKEAIILRELYNYECYYSGDIEDAVEALEAYEFPYTDIIEVYRSNYAEAMEAL